jgi:hypothetical protein
MYDRSPVALAPVRHPGRQIFGSIAATLENLEYVKVSVEVDQIFDHILIDFRHGLGVADWKLRTADIGAALDIVLRCRTCNNAQDAIDLISRVCFFEVDAFVEHSEPVGAVSQTLLRRLVIMAVCACMLI